jgi:Outer membrane lipoprotein-sorting protein
VAALKGAGRASCRAVAIAAALSLSATARGADVASVRECVRANAPRLSAVQTLSLSVREPGGELVESRAKLTWRRLSNGSHRLLMRYLAPDDLAGSALLLELGSGPPIVHLYLPELGDPQRVYSEEQVAVFLGQSDVDASELAWLVQEAGRSDVRVLETPSEHAGRPVFALEAHSAKGAETRFARVEALVDREWCLPLVVTFYGADGSPRKRLLVAPGDVRREGQVWVPHRIELENLEEGTHSTLRVESIEVDVPIAPGLLTVKALKRTTVSGGGASRKPDTSPPRP